MYIPKSTPYNGPSKLLVGLDIGTINSSISILSLSSGVIPNPINYPSQIPSVVLFNKTSKKVVACGEAALGRWKAPHDENEVLVKQFKLHLHPAKMRWDPTSFSAARSPPSPKTPNLLSPPNLDITPLPEGLKINLIYSEFYKHLFVCVRELFVERIGSEEDWDKQVMENFVEFVVSVADGWDESQQRVLKMAMVEGGLVTARKADDNVHFIREAEASVHFLLEKSRDVGKFIKEGECFTVVNAGGSTVNTCMYRCDAVTPKLLLREIKPSDSVTAGGIYVDRAAFDLIKSQVATTSEKPQPQTVDEIVDAFEKSTKRSFGSPAMMAQDPVLQKVDVESTFAFCVNEILASVDQQLEVGNQQSSHVVLTGGFGDSPYLQTRLKEAIGPELTLLTSPEPSSQHHAVSEGTLHWFMNKQVASRAVRSTFGNVISVQATPLLRREEPNRTPFVWMNGEEFLTGGWCTIVSRGDVMKTTDPVKMPFYQLLAADRVSDLGMFSTTVYSYDGTQHRPLWCQDSNGTLMPGFSERCRVMADLSKLSGLLQAVPRKDGTEGSYYRIDFKVCLFVAENSLNAKLEWVEGNKVRQGPASVVISEGLVEVGSAQYSGSSGTRAVSAKYVSSRSTKLDKLVR